MLLLRVVISGFRGICSMRPILRYSPLGAEESLPPSSAAVCTPPPRWFRIMMCLVLLLLIVPRRVQTSDMGSYGVTVGPAYPASLLLPVVGLVPLLRTYAECLPAGSEKPSSNILVVFLERRVHPFLSGCYTVYRSTTRKHFTNKTLQQPT